MQRQIRPQSVGPTDSVTRGSQSEPLIDRNPRLQRIVRVVEEKLQLQVQQILGEGGQGAATKDSSYKCGNHL